MNVFEADSRQAVASGALVIAAAIVASLICLGIALVLPWSFITFVLLLLTTVLASGAAWVGYHTVALRHICYTLDRNALIIRYGPERTIVPLIAVQQVLPAAELGGSVQLRRLLLPGWWIGRARHASLGDLQFYATQPAPSQIVVVTQGGNYVITPVDGDGFMAEMRAHQQAGPTHTVRQTHLQPGLMAWPLWHNRTALLLLLLPVAINLATFALGFARFPALPSQIALHYDAIGQPDRSGASAQVLMPSIIALSWLVANSGIGLLAYRREKLAAYLVWGGSAGAQLFFLAATLTISFPI